MSSIPFEINSLLLDFIYEGKGDFLFSKEDKDDKKSYEITLGQAYILRDKKFYIPLKARGRIYTDSYYLNYQGDDFSTAIIQFAEGEPLTEIGLRNLYIYIANVYNFEGISKKNFHERIKWVEENKFKILSMDPDFIVKAEDKFKFTALSLLLIELEKDPKYIVKLPIFFDATCSGIQHLAGIIIIIFV